MELHRAINPDWQFSDTTNYLLAKIASIESERLFIDVARAWDDDKHGPVPERWWPTTYGPIRDADAVTDPATAPSQDDDDARAVAAEFVAMQQLA